MIDIERLVRDGEIISTDKYLKFTEENERFEYHFRDFLFREGYKRGKKIDRLVLNLDKVKGKNLVIGHSDWTLRKVQTVPFFLAGVDRIYATNLEPFGDKLNPLPLGITNDCNDSAIHPILGNENHFKLANDVEPLKQFDGSIYINFTTNTFPKERQAVIELLKDYPKLIKKDLIMSDESRKQYLRDLRTHSLVPCPRGNGIDTHRLWETLYMGGTPVVRRNPIIESITKDLPVIYVKSWNEIIDTELMNRKWENIRKEKWNMEKLKLSFWVAKMNENK